MKEKRSSSLPERRRGSAAPRIIVEQAATNITRSLTPEEFSPSRLKPDAITIPAEIPVYHHAQPPRSFSQRAYQDDATCSELTMMR